VFTGLTAGTYTVTAKNASGCISLASADIVINAQPAAPSAPTASASAQPTCSIATGTITVSSILTGLTFSIDGLTYTNTTGVFTGLSAGTYTVTAKNEAGCISQASSEITINAQPATPSAPTASATAQPTCSVATGTITVSSSLTGLTFSIDGLTYANTTGVFTGLSAGTYSVTAKNEAGCISLASADIVINAQPAAPTSVVSGNATICAGTSTSISIALTGSQPWSLTYTDGTTPVTVNNITASPYIFTVTPSSSKTYTVTALSDSACSAHAGGMTGNAIVTVNPSLVASVSIASNDADNRICVGTSVMFTATPTNGGASPAYQWQLGGVNINGATSSTYITTGLTNGNQIRVLMTVAPVACLSGSPATSNAITTVVNALPAVTTGTAGARCGPGTVVLVANAVNGTTVDWYAAATGGSVLAGGSGVTRFTTPSISTTTTYYAERRNTTTGCVSATRVAVVATVNAIPVPPAASK
jgi:polyisoprenoid-binding protein YceI